MLSSEPGITVMDSLDVTPHHTKFTKKPTKTRKRKNQLDGTQLEPSPVPHTKLTKINEMHEKGDRGGVDAESGLP